MQSLDWIVLLVFSFVLMAIVVWVLKRKDDTSSDYFLSGRSETWLAIGAAIFAANIGSEHLVGLAGSGAESGMAMAHWEMHGWMILILGWVFVPFYARSRVFTMPEFLSLRYNRGASSFLSIITLIGYVLTKVSVTAYTGGIFLKTVFGIESIGNIDFFWIAAIGLVLVTGLFTVLGGMRGIMMISVIQTPILLGGALTILILGLMKLGGGGLFAGWHEMVKYTDHVNPIYMHLTRPVTDPKFPGVGVFVGAAIIGFWYWCTDQHIVQRALTAKNLTQARRGSIFAGYLKISPVFLFLIPGMIAAVLRAKGLVMFDGNDKAYGSLVTYLLPMGIKGLVVVGFVAALMTSLAAHFNSSATLFTIDFYKKYKPDTSEHKLVWIGRLATISVVVLGLVWIPMMKGLGAVLYEYLQNVQSLIAPAIAAVFLLGVFNKWITPKAGQWGLIIGFSLGMFRLLLLVFKPAFLQPLIDINWLHFEIFLFLFTMALMFGISFFTPKPDQASIQGITFFSRTPEQIAESKASWSKWDVVNSVAVLGICIAFYIYFW
ncbi:MAG TPA: sodium:solute symporter [Bacteroidales bacterium]|nr:sodium:solute symporter [Bacteroidales bacterium]